MDAQEMIDLILEYADEHPAFDTSFIESLQDWLSEHDELTCGQYSALENIGERFHIW